MKCGAIEDDEVELMGMVNQADDKARARALYTLLDHNQRDGGKQGKLFHHLLKEQDANGCWTSSWPDVTTALAIRFFDDCGMTLDTTWHKVDIGGEAGPLVGLPLALEYLKSSFADGHRWGNDWFDHAKVLQILADIPVLQRAGSHAIGNEEIERAHQSLVSGLALDFQPDNVRPRKSEWSGAATFAASAMAFKAIGDNTNASLCIERLLTFQNADSGVFVGTDPLDETVLVWHTANALIALSVAGAFPIESPVIERGAAWLLDPENRCHDLSWGAGQREKRVDMTAYVGRAFHHIGHDETDTVEELVEHWLMDIQDADDGGIGPSEGSIHAAVFLVDTGRMDLQALKVLIPSVKAVEIQSVLSGLVSDIGHLEVSLATAQSERDAALAEVEPTKRELASAKDEIQRRSTGIHISNGWQFLGASLLAVLLFFLGLWFVSDRNDEPVQAPVFVEIIEGEPDGAPSGAEPPRDEAESGDNGKTESDG